jgi:hypothetical protein
VSDKVIQFSESTGNASGRLGIAQKQADDFLVRIQTQDEQATKLAAELKGISAYAQSKEERTAIVAALANDPSFKTELAKVSSSSWDPVKQTGFVLFGETLICYGTASLQYKYTQHTCPFEFLFPKEFAGSPAVSQSVRVDDPKGSGYTYGVYRSALTPTGYTGVLTEIQGRDINTPVVMSYVAIGKIK